MKTPIAPTVNMGELNTWLEAHLTGELDGTYAHHRLIQNAPAGWHPLFPQLVRYFESAHIDARELFHDTVGLSLDPLSDTHFEYPRSMPPKTRRGYFGEAMCALLATTYQLVTHRHWQVPVFLFRFHSAAGEHLMRLLNSDDAAAEIPGRTGSDCLAVALADDGKIAAILGAEAKCHNTFGIGHARKGLQALSAETCLPVSLGQFRQVLMDIDPPRLSSLIESIHQLLLARAVTDIPRVDLLLYAFDDPGTVEYTSPRITPELVQEEYTCSRPLHVIELNVPNLTQLITRLYDTMYTPSEMSGAHS